LVASPDLKLLQPKNAEAQADADPPRKPAQSVDIKSEKTKPAKLALVSAEGAPPTAPKQKLGLRPWMERVLDECDRAAAGFDVDAVHDLRVALRRCRSLADGLIALDPDRSWRRMKKAGKTVFQALGGLRDMQVLQEWVEKLGDADDPVTVKLLNHVQAREAECKQEAWKHLSQFDRKQWREWARTLPRRASRVRPGSVVYLHLALEKWTDTYELHKQALRRRSQTSWHALRIGIKRFRYTVENFLPAQHDKWGDDLKQLQDALGEVHDLDVLWNTATEIHAFHDVASRTRWRQVLTAAREERIALYRERMVGRESLWRAWRSELPQGKELRAAAMSRMRVWAGYQDPDFAHAQRVEKLALNLYDGLCSAGLVGKDTDGANANGAAGASQLSDARAVLQAASLMQDVGMAKRWEKHHKRSYRMIREMTRPLGWETKELALAAVVARYHRGALPTARAKTMRPLGMTERRTATELAGVLRLANALDVGHEKNGAARSHSARLTVEVKDGIVAVRTRDYAALDRSAENIAAARHLLETVLRMPVMVAGVRKS
jgi:CHAD domain-containing protein